MPLDTIKSDPVNPGVLQIQDPCPKGYHYPYFGSGTITNNDGSLICVQDAPGSE